MAIARKQNHDRFTVALMVAMGVHAFALLAVAFVLELDFSRVTDEALDVVLVNWRSEEAPDEADFLAQASQQGGGDAERPMRPSETQSAVLPSFTEGDAPVQADEQRAAPTEAELEQLVREADVAQDAVEVTEIEQDTPDTPSAAELVRQSMQMARLEPEIRREAEWNSKLPRREYISANTKEYEFASYMQAWVAKVERIGNLNYPEEVRKRNLFGDLLMTVGIRADGTVESIDIKRSSGLPELDDAAVHIVQMAAPYSPLPETIRERADVLHITRTWRFSSNNRLE